MIMATSKYTTIDARPVKRFFVEMLTRDIQIEDAILDLLDNCVDGVLRNPKVTEPHATYNGFWAKITVNRDTFEIEDNCGGIPWSEHDRAFRMGRPVAADQGKRPPGVGAYGIGMKRAIFKMGSQALILTQNGEDSYKVLISAEWIGAEDDWSLQPEPNDDRMTTDGTHILIQGLHNDVSERFAAESFEGDLIKKIESHYAVIIGKGLRVKVNGKELEPNPIVVRFASEVGGDSEVRPYMFRSTYEGVDVFMAIGLREPIPGIERVSEEQDGVKFSSDYAGWTVICNDRVVLYCDRSELTGWGLFGIPRYHTQFIAISGVVEFHGDPKKLPTTTTKRGLKFESSLYQQVLDRMRDGLKMFIDFTNKWKTMEDEAKRLVAPVPAIPYSQVKAEAMNLKFQKTHTGLEGEQYKPKLPMPSSHTTDVRLSYIRARRDVTRLAEVLLPDIDDFKAREIPRAVGEASFDFALKHFFSKK